MLVFWREVLGAKMGRMAVVAHQHEKRVTVPWLLTDRLKITAQKMIAVTHRIQERGLLMTDSDLSHLAEPWLVVWAVGAQGEEHAHEGLLLPAQRLTVYVEKVLVMDAQLSARQPAVQIILLHQTVKAAIEQE